jgi:hypothetical protein
MMVMGASGSVEQTGICKNCGQEITLWVPDYMCPIYQTDQPIWLHQFHGSGSTVWCQVTKAEPLEE